jgi:hypothetical protein
MKKFDVICLPEKTKKLFFQYRYVNVSKSITKEIDLKKIDIYLKDYRIKVSEAVLEQYSNSIYEDILNELNSGIHFITMKHPKHRYEKWLRGLFFLDTMSLMKKLFISTIVYLSEGAKCPETESITFTFDLDAEEVIISSLTLYMPENNPYYKYAQKAAVNLSVESIGLLNYADNNKKIKNFYNESVVGKWKKASELEKEKDVKDIPGIYMLYNADTNELYVGKAVRIKERIEQHQKDVEEIASLGIRLKRAESYSKSVAVTTLADTVVVRDTIVMRDTVPIPAHHFVGADTWSRVEGILFGDSVRYSVHTIDTLHQVVHRVPRKFLLIPYGTKAIRQEVWSSNPNTELVYTEYIELPKRRKRGV